MINVAGRWLCPRRKHDWTRVIAVAGAVIIVAIGQQFPANATPTAPSQPVTSATRVVAIAPVRPVTRATAAVLLSAREIAALSVNVSDPVIVLLRDQPAMARPGSRGSAVRSAAIAAAQAPLLAELRLVHARRITSYRLVDALAATVSAAEAARLRANPAVAEVAQDALINNDSAGPAPFTARRRPARPATTPEHRLAAHVIPRACGANGKTLLDPEALQTTHTASDNSGQATARSLGITGAGVRVAYIADGIDPNNVNFIRPDGRSVFDRAFGGDYEDFTGDGPGQLTNGAEAFIDANSIAGQGRHRYDVRRFAAQSYPQPCNIKIEGVAPGAALVGLDVFGTFEATLESNFLEAISYAVETDHVNVINESFGSNPFPDVTALSVTDLFNDAAVAAGTTVTVAAGDSGITNTVASPASDPHVISVGASTTFRFYAQTNYAAARYFASTGWLDDNVSAISSSGFTESNRTVSLVAPGDLGFASCSTDVNIFEGCSSLKSNPSPVELSGGTSEAAPLTAGAAALVIQAYRQTHEGSTPSPATVKEILTSTATDLGLPASEQGSGLLNTYKAVSLAESIKSPFGSPAPVGNTLLISRSQLSYSGQPGASRTWPVTVTNEGTSTQLITATGRTLGPDDGSQQGSVMLADDRSPEFTDASGQPDNYAEFHFAVRPGMKRLDASIAYQGAIGSELAPVRLILIDPRGRFAADSVPQGTGNFGNVDVRAPVPGTWTGMVSSVTAFEGGTNGKVRWQVFTQRFAHFGTVRPAAFLLAPGQSRILRVTAQLPAEAGDSAGSIVLRSDQGGTDGFLGRESESIPVTLRSKVDLAGGGAFGGTLTGGNGRPPGVGQVSYFEFHVGRGHRSITANISLTRDMAEMVGAYLVSPDGQALGAGQNSEEETNSRSLTAYVLDPEPGNWMLVIDFSGPVPGDTTAQRFMGNIELDRTLATATGLPDSPKRLLKRGVPVTAQVKITNTGAAPEDYFLDPRLVKRTTIELESETGKTFPLPVEDLVPEWLVPTQTASVRVAAKATVPIEFDYGPIQGHPDLVSTASPDNRAAGSYTPPGGTVGPGNWFAAPDEIGPYPDGAPGGKAELTMTATTRAFDRSVTTQTGDLWLASQNPLALFNPFTIEPGQSAVITVRIKPKGPSGTVVHGDLFVDDYVSAVPPYGQTTADELVAIPYAYKIK
jgi:Subtilase family